MPDLGIVRTGREPADAENTVPDLLPVWLTFPALIFAIACAMVLTVSIFVQNVWPVLIPIGLVCGLVAISNLVAIRLNINANKS